MSDAAAIGPTLFIIGCLIVGLPLLNADTTAGRLLPCLACVLLIARTIAWRVTETLPPFALTPDAIGAYLFVFFELLSSATSILLFVVLSPTIDRPNQATPTPTSVITRNIPT